MKGFAKGFLALLSFFTIIPTGVYDIRLASTYFFLVPVVGAIEGLISGSITFLPLPILLKLTIIAFFMFLITGFNHVDGFADFVDALASRRTANEALKLMKEGRSGPVAVISTALLLLFIFSSFLSMKESNLFGYCILSMASASESMYILAFISRESSYEGLGKRFITDSKGLMKIIINLLLYLSIVIPISIEGLSLLPIHLTMLISTILLSCVVIRKLAYRTLGFVSGDVLGFCFETNKALTLVILACLN